MATMPEIIINVTAAEIAKLALNPGDTIVLRYAGNLSIEIADRLKGQLESIFSGHKALVLDQGLELSIVSPNGGE